MFMYTIGCISKKYVHVFLLSSYFKTLKYRLCGYFFEFKLQGDSGGNEVSNTDSRATIYILNIYTYFKKK